MTAAKRRMSTAFAFVLVVVIPGFLIILSETMQLKENLWLYWWVYKNVGHVWADIALGQLGDLMAPIMAGGICMLFYWGLNLIFKPDLHELYADGVKLCSCAISIIYVLAETVSIFAGTTECGNPNELCKGEFRDLLSFSAPLLAYGVWRVIKHNRMKRNT